MRRILKEISTSNIPNVVGLCAEDYPRLTQQYINPATEELMNLAGETGFWGGWDKIVINMPCSEAYITVPPQYSRLINMDVCRWPIPIFNEFYEVLEAGIGLQTPCAGRWGCGLQAAFERANVPTVVDLTPANQFLRLYISDARDINKRIVFLEAKDGNGMGIYSTDVQNQINGFPLVFNQPFVTSAFIVSSFTAIVKDVTYGDVILKQVDATTGAEVQLARYGPKETNPVFRRYYLQAGCPTAVGTGATTRQVTAMAKLEYRPVSEPMDLLLISNFPALEAKCDSLRLQRMDNPQAKAMSLFRHRQAVKMLNQELTSHTGSQPSVVLALHGTAKLERQRIGLVW